MYEFMETKLFWITAVIAAVYIYLKYYLFNYWNRQNVCNVTPTIPLGNISVSYLQGKIHFGGLTESLYEKFKHLPFHGLYFFHRPVISINDPELIRLILVKDFDRFTDRGWFLDDKVDALASNLFLLPGEKWKRLRAKFSPIFTSAKLKQMYPLLVDISTNMINACDVELKSNDVLNVKDILGRFTTDVISSIVYGFNCKSLENTSSEFHVNGIKAISLGKLNMLLGVFAPEILSYASFPLYVQNLQTFFLDVFKDAVEYRRKEKVQKKDFLSLIMQLMDSGKIEEDKEASESNTENLENNEKLTLAEAAAQAFIFFLGGYETTSSTASYCLFEMALNPDIQEKLQAEIDEVVNSETGLTYENIATMEYLDMVISETLRKYPSVPILNRICIEDYPLPNSNFVIPKGMRLIIPVLGIQKNSKYFPDPQKFDPLRFTKANDATRSHYVDLAFGSGRRDCIGKRFGLMQLKTSITSMLYNYKFSISEKTELPMQYVVENFVQTPKNLLLKAQRRNLSS